MLKAMGLPQPTQILAHGFWEKDGEKISKSTGNIVDPLSVIDEWGLDAFRYYVTRELDLGPDGNWTDAGFQARYQAELGFEPPEDGSGPGSGEEWFGPFPEGTPDPLPAPALPHTRMRPRG